MDVSTILARLEGVRSSGPDRWVAKCPSHADRSPSLAIRATEDGRILMHCFAGCEVVSIVHSIGLDLTDLFPEPLVRDNLPRIRAPFSALDALKCLVSESRIVAIAASDIVEGKPLTPTDANRVAAAAGRIASALEAAHG